MRQYYEAPYVKPKINFGHRFAPPGPDSGEPLSLSLFALSLCVITTKPYRPLVGRPCLFLDVIRRY